MVYFTVLISSAKGWLNETRFVAGNIGRLFASDILRVSAGGIGLFLRTERRLCGCLYGILIIAESVEDKEVVEVAEIEEAGVEAEVGVLFAASRDIIGVGISAFGGLGVDGPRTVGSYALLNVFLTVGETAESVSNLRLEPEPLPKVNDCGGASEVFNESFGRAGLRCI